MTGIELRAIRLQAGIKQKDVAIALGMTACRLANLEETRFQCVPPEFATRYLRYVLDQAEGHWRSIRQYRAVLKRMTMVESISQ